MDGSSDAPSVQDLVEELVEGVTPVERRLNVETMTKAYGEIGEMDDANLDAAAGRTLAARRQARAVFVFQMALGWEHLISDDPPGAFACFQAAAKQEPHHPAVVEALEIIRKKWGVA